MNRTDSLKKTLDLMSTNIERIKRSRVNSSKNITTLGIRAEALTLALIDYQGKELEELLDVSTIERTGTCAASMTLRFVTDINYDIDQTLSTLEKILSIKRGAIMRELDNVLDNEMAERIGEKVLDGC